MGTMRSLERLGDAVGTAQPRPRRWLTMGAAVVGAGVMGALSIQLMGVAGELITLAAGGAGALVAASAMWIRNGSTDREQTSQAETGWSALHAEVARSRRHERPFTIVGIPERLWAPQPADSTERTKLGLNMASSLQTLLRTPDRAWLDDPLLYVLLTDCNRAQAEAFLRRARAHMPQLHPANGLGVAVFPEDGVTLGALLNEVEAGELEHTAELLAS